MVFLYLADYISDLMATVLTLRTVIDSYVKAREVLDKKTTPTTDPEHPKATQTRDCSATYQPFDRH